MENRLDRNKIETMWCINIKEHYNQVKTAETFSKAALQHVNDVFLIQWQHGETSLYCIPEVTAV